MENFDFNTIGDFDGHIQKSIPNFNVLIDCIKSTAEYFYCKNSNVYDLGCSTGSMLKAIQGEFSKIGYDNSKLLPKEEGFYNVDLNSNFKIDNASVVFSIFTMQFLDQHKRADYLKTIFEGINSGGALFICEKTYQESGKIQEIMSFSHYDYKLKNFEASEIIKKERDLRFIMKPCLGKELNNMLLSAGFDSITTFWQVYNFKGILAIKK